ncbi:MAG: hypothetical protein QM689_04520 [Oscillospiraceae bacterium]
MQTVSVKSPLMPTKKQRQLEKAAAARLKEYALFPSALIDA